MMQRRTACGVRGAVCSGAARGVIATASAAVALFMTAAFAADPSPKPKAAEPQTASPAVSGDDLQNLNRGAAAPASEPEPQTADQTDADRSTQTTGATGAAASSRRPQAASASRASDRLELDTTVVTGNRELPKVLYIVPWKKADLGDLPQQPFNTLLDEVLTPVDRDVFRREVTYFDAVTSGADANQSTSDESR